jgi:molecular chaperone GrpE
VSSDPTVNPVSPAPSDDAGEQPGTANGGAQAEANGADPRLAELEAKLKEEKQRYLYLYADFENFKKRAIKERSDAIKFGWEATARDLLQVIDNLERAVEHMPPTTDHTLRDGLHMIMNQFRATLEKQGVQIIKTAEAAFDPNLHEAVAQEASEQPEGTVVKEHQRGYTLHGRLLRPARVVVSSGKN